MVDEPVVSCPAPIKAVAVAFYLTKSVKIKFKNNVLLTCSKRSLSENVDPSDRTSVRIMSYEREKKKQRKIKISNKK